MNRFNTTHLTPVGSHPLQPSLIDAIGVEVAKLNMEDGAAEAELIKAPILVL